MFAEDDRQTNFQAGFDMNFGDQFYWVALTNIKNSNLLTEQPNRQLYFKIRMLRLTMFTLSKSCIGWRCVHSNAGKLAKYIRENYGFARQNSF